MSDVFISYSRVDSEFVRELQQQLLARGREAWVDWRDIPPTAEWLQEIYAGIEASNAVIFVLSPEFLASEICGLEVAHAKEFNKRLIPVVRRDIDVAQVDDVLAKLNWIFFREQDDADASFRTLLTALDTDLEYDRESTRILVRAVEWKGRGRADAVTLRGGELEDAERWLAQGISKTPSPSPFQVEYITASRKAVGRRQRRLLTGVSVALVVTLVLSVVSFALFQLAQAREQIAQANYTQALARQLAAQSLNHVSDQRDLAMLLAVEAFRRDPRSGEAADAMLTALETGPQLAGFAQDYADSWASVAFSPDGQLLAAGSMKGTIVFWDAATHRQVGGAIVVDQRAAGPIQIAFSRDGRLIGSAGAGTTLRVWNVSTHQMVAQSPSLAPVVSIGGIAFWACPEFVEG